MNSVFHALGDATRMAIFQKLSGGPIAVNELALMLPVSRFLGREERWLGYIIAYNWAQIPQQLLALASTLLVAGGLLPAPPVFAVTIAAVLVYGAFIARVALDVSRTVATMIVLLDFTLGIFLSQVFQALH